MKKRILAFMTLQLIVCQLVLAQSPQGRLFLSLSPASFGYVEYPINNFHLVDSIQSADIAIYKNRVYAGGKDLYVYDALSLQLLDTVQDVYLKKMSLHNDQLFLISDSMPYLRVLDINNSYTELFSIDTNKIGAGAADVLAMNTYCFVLFSKSMMVVDIAAQDTLTSVPTFSVIPSVSFNTFMCSLNNKIYIHTDYATGAFRYSLLEFDPQTFANDTVYHHEFQGGTTKLVPARDRIYLLYNTSYYDFITDSVYVHGSFGDYVVAFDSLTSSIFLAGDLINPFNGYVSYYSPTDSATLSLSGPVRDAEFMAGPLGLNEAYRPVGSLSIYPNPSSNSALIDFGDDVDIKKIIIFDTSGKMIYEEHIGRNIEQHVLDLSTFASGSYIVRCSSGSRQFSGILSIIK